MQQQQQQQATGMVPLMPSFPPPNITTDQIQKYLDDNKKLILAIMENQNLGKLSECAQYQAQLQKNLMYLAAIADAQPQTPPMPSQIAPHPVMPQGGFYMQQHPQAAAMAQQPPALFSQKMPPQFNPSQDHHYQQSMQGQMSMRLSGPHNAMHPASSGPASLPAPVGPSSDVRGVNKKDAPEAGAGAGATVTEGSEGAK